MNPVSGAIFSPLMFLPGILLRFLPFTKIVNKSQRIKLTASYAVALLIHGGIYYLVGLGNGALNITFLKADMIIFAFAATCINMIFIKGRVKEHLFTYGTSMLLNYMTLTFTLFFSNIFMKLTGSNRVFLIYVLIYFALHIIFFPISLKLLKITVTPFLDIENKNYWKTIWFVPIAMFLSCYFTFYGEDKINTLPPFVGRMFLFVSAIILCINIAHSYKRMSRQIQTEKQLDMQNAYYHELSEQVSKARQSRHDMKHHMAAIQRYIETDDKLGLQDYCYDFSAEISADYIPYTGNAAADGVIYHYAKNAKENKIRFEMQGRIKSKKLSDVDLCSLLGNALDNAITGCLTIKTDRYISVVAESNKHNLTIMVTNSFDGIINKNKETVLSRKADGRHGVGLTSMKSVCEKYGGSMDIDYNKNRFTSIFILPI